MNALQGYELNEVLSQGLPSVAGSLVGAADVRQYGMLDSAISQGTPDNMSFISVILSAAPQ